MRQYPKIHFILPGGGIRGAFQAGFLYQLFKTYRKDFDIARVDGTSVGSLNGFAIMTEQYEFLKDIWLNITDINDFFDNWSNNYLIGKVSSLISGFYNNGLFSNAKIESIIKKTHDENWVNFENTYKEKYSCVVVDIEKANSKYITGDNDNICEYITASCSPWIVSNPVKVEDVLYTDGGLLETYPIKNIGKCNADITVIVGYDQEHFKYILGENDNIIKYLANLIDIVRFNSKNIIDVREIINSKKVISLSNPMKLSFMDFKESRNIEDGFDMGIDFANTFYNSYIKDFNDDINKSRLNDANYDPFEKYNK